MNPARAMVLMVAAVMAVVVYLLMRRPSMRRAQFQGGRAFSVAVSFGCAVRVAGVACIDGAVTCGSVWRECLVSLEGGFRR